MFLPMLSPLNSEKSHYLDSTRAVWPESINDKFLFSQNILGWLSRMNLIFLVSSADGEH